MKKEYKSIYPRVFRYSDSKSVRKDSITDLKISYAKNQIARSSTKINKDDGVLVVARPSGSDDIYCFACIAEDFIGETSLWDFKGGSSWKYGYKVKKLSEMVKINKAIIEAVVGCDELNWKIFNGLPLSNSFLLSKNGKAVAKVFRYCVDNYPIINPNVTIFKDLSELDKIKIY